MGYSNIRSDKRHEADAARIKELEEQLIRERERRIEEAMKSAAEESHANETVTVEKTSKQLKKQLLASWVCILVGILSYSKPNICGTLIAVGVLALVYTKLKIWWRHG